MPGKHSILSPSGAHRWLECPGSLAACKHIKDETSVDAASGTLTHQMAQAFLTGSGDNYGPCIGETVEVEGYKFEIDQERIDRVAAYCNAILREPGTLYVEQWLDLSAVLGIPDQGGTGDAIKLDYASSTIGVHDLKDGANIVHAKDNPQLILYGLGALHEYFILHDWKAVKVAIHQPRMDHYDECTYTIEELYQWQHRLAQAGQAAYWLYEKGSAEQVMQALVPGHAQCHWCKIRHTCSARAQAVLDSFPAAVEEPLVQMLDNTEIASALARVPEIENWCRDIRSEALKRALAGAALPGFKMVRGKKSARSWIDEDEAVAKLQLFLPPEDCYQPRKPVTPTAAEKALKKAGVEMAVFAGLITQSDGSLSVVADSDDRPAAKLPGATLTDFPTAPVEA